MKTLHLSIITGIGISVLIAFGILALIYSNSFLSIESKPSCNDAPNSSVDKLSLNNTTWLSVMEIDANQTKLECTSVDHTTLLLLPNLEQALQGASKCKDGEFELCTPPAPVRISKIYNFGVPVEDSLDYEISLTEADAKNLFFTVKLSTNGNQAYGDVQYNGKYYQIIVSTSDKDIPPQVYAEFPQKVSYPPPTIREGQSIKYPIIVKTLATYGRPAAVQLSMEPSTTDSGLEIKVEPDKLVIPERSQANATLIVTSTPNTLNGTYGISVTGKTPYDQFGVCRFDCPSIKVGDSDWRINEYFGGTVIGQGGNKPPQWLKFETRLNKQEYNTGDIVEIGNFLTNDGPNKITLDGNMQVAVNVYTEDMKRGYQYYYTIQAQYQGNPLTVEPHSTVPLARPLHWDQTSYWNSNLLHRVEPGVYHVDVTFGGYNGTAWDNDIPIEIK